ncbi:DUF87 domain-containing protein [Campylobacter sp. JMF_01 NE2]|uniref:ATP-binding protein n=1 Tax=unclassified Campylobacter TaxID=2593542 RepID=UPI0022EA0A12|nr:MULTISPECIES: DUF87 domain-containing protein [unclassified Campylobacter]MDA3053699.1 DUF87 domain-containing protein [Campylobacter sp. JMF_03 NE3]MDA3067892.1 DUF87 domain-containing protein [Campylobacter sp. JMF_01 NE2]
MKDLLKTKHILARMIQEPEINFIGNVFKLSYESAKILTNDAYKERVKGIPLNSFLIGATFDPNNFDRANESEKVVFLFRMNGPCDIPGDDDKIRTIIEHYQSQSEIYSEDKNDGIEPITHSWLQFGGLECEVIGSFYMGGADGNQLVFGADIEDFQSMANIKVYKPITKVLDYIVNYIDPNKKQKMKQDCAKMGFVNVPEAFEIGNLRYTSTNRLQKMNKEFEVVVRVYPADFLARRTAVFGMTRTGKSNTVKTTISAVSLAAKRAQIRVGQLIFDMNGEYANANGQDDGSSINDVFYDNTIRYRGMKTPKFYDLRDNFYESLENGLEIIKRVLEQRDGLSDSFLKFLSLELSNKAPQDRSAKTKWEKSVAIYKMLLLEMGFETNIQLNFKFTIGEDIYEALYNALKNTDKFKNEDISNLTNKNSRVGFMKSKFGDPSMGMDEIKFKDFLMMIREANIVAKNRQNEIRTNSGKPWLSGADEGMLNLIAGKNDKGTPINTKSYFKDAFAYHSPSGNKNIREEIFNHLKDGRIVILDLSVGLQSVKTNMSEKIAWYILNKNIEIVNNNEPPLQCVLYVEEAHNLIGKTNKLDETWPRIAKEGAKFGIALVYATQEPSSVHPNILANTENLFVTHLNNDDEIKALSKYYDFKSFANSIKKAQDVGFARIKTLSSNYVVPTQIKLFDPKKLKEEYEKLPNPMWFSKALTPEDKMEQKNTNEKGLFSDAI